jgi:LPXTG-motif cell wall-anchored protein
VTSGKIGPIPATSECVITETGHGAANAAAKPVTVTIPWDTTTRTAGDVTASLTNYYSAGRISVGKVVKGDEELVSQVKDRTFKVQVTCQVTEAGKTADVYSGVVSVKAGQTVDVLDASGAVQLLPLGARCFADEVDNGGATAVSVDHDSAAHAVEVTTGASDAVQALSITVTNTFQCSADTCKLAQTGAAGAWAALAGLGLLSLGLVLLLGRRRRTQE